MRYLRCLTILGIVCGPLGLRPSPGFIHAEERAPDQDRLEEQVRGLLKDLAGQTRAQRTAAEKRLRELGPRILPHLPPPELLPSASVRETVRLLRADLERVKARESVLPSRITIRGRNTVGKALAEISRQTGNAVDGHALPEALLERELDWDVAEVPFWKALDDLVDRLALRYEYDAALRALKLALADRDVAEARRAVAHSGAFRIAVLHAERIVRSAGPGASQKGAEGDDLVRVSLELLSEPRLRALFLQVAAAEIKARAGEIALRPFSPEANYELALGEAGGRSRFTLDYLVPGSVRSTAISLAGRLRCTTAAGNEPIRFAGITKLQGQPELNIARRRGGVTVTLNRVRGVVSDGKGELRVRVTVAYDSGGPAFETHRTWILHNDVFLQDAEGNRVRLNGGSETERQADGTLVIEYRFVDLPDPFPDFAFVYVAPSLIVDVPIDFEIQSASVENRK